MLVPDAVLSSCFLFFLFVVLVLFIYYYFSILAEVVSIKSSGQIVLWLGILI